MEFVILHLRAAVQQLYAAEPAAFMTLRSALVAEAKQAGDPGLAKQIGALRKPTTAAWAINHFVRTRPDDLESFREFAQLLREAQRTLDADQLRVLGRERARRVDAVGLRIADAAQASGVTLGPSVLEEVHESLVALIADEDAERAILTGSLVKALSYSGFGSVDIEDAAAMGHETPALTVIEGGARSGVHKEGLQKEVARDECDRKAPAQESAAEDAPAVDLEQRRQARREAERAALARALEAARAKLRAADRHVAVLTARQEEVTEGIADLERRLATARQRHDTVTTELEEAIRVRDETEAAEAAAQHALSDYDASR